MNVLIKQQRKDLRTYLEVLGQSQINLEENLAEDSFNENIITILDIDKEVGTLIFQELTSDGDVTGQKFINYVNKFMPVQKQISEEIKEEKQESPKREAKGEFDPSIFVQQLEESKFPIFNLLDFIHFNENGKTIAKICE